MGHRCQWLLLEFHAFARPSVQLSMSLGFGITDKSLGKKVYILARWYIQMTYPQLIYAYEYWYLSVRLSINHIFRFLCICWQITWKEWHKKRIYPRPTSMPMDIVVMSGIRPSVRPSMELSLGIADKSLGRNGLTRYILACWCTLMTSNHTAWMPMGIVAISCIRPSNCLWVWGLKLRKKSPGRKVYILACWCIQMTCPQCIDACG